MLDDVDAFHIHKACRLLDMAMILSQKRKVKSSYFSKRYGIDRATVFRDRNELYDVLGVRFAESSGKYISVEDDWTFEKQPLLEIQIKAIRRAIEETDDEIQKRILKSIL